MRLCTTRILSFTLPSVVALVAACSANSSGNSEETDGTDSTPGETETDIRLEQPNSSEDNPNFDLPALDTCGNGTLDDGEVCEHGIANPTKENVTEPGCFWNCRGVDSGYLCLEPAQPCKQFAICGDGVQAFPEQCDDGARSNGDGCSENCKLEIGYKCEGSPSTCSPTTCGDGVVEGAEMCETGDAGCTAECQFAPDCSGGGACTSACGDGLVLGEACDDGNNLPGDGCSPECEVEQGYMCPAVQGQCETDSLGNCIQRVPVVYRDFSHSHPDFGQDNENCGGAVVGAVENMLGADGKPVGTSAAASNPCMTGLDTDWFRDTDNNVRFNDSLVLYQNESGGFVNRHGPNGEPFYVTAAVWNGNLMVNCGMEECGPFDGSPAFLPIDGRPGALDDGGDPAAYLFNELYGGTGNHIWFTTDGQFAAGDKSPPANVSSHNFSFTSEITYWFAFEADTQATFDFVGDDDVWVFVNGQRAVDLGGRHPALQGSFSLDGSAPSYGMEPGNVYEIKLFHAEREAHGSNFKLTLSGFNTSRSDCIAQCGDGFIGFGEECDDGENNLPPGTGEYASCSTECKLQGGFCGNGVLDEEEQCDASAEANPSCVDCRLIVVR